MSSLVTKAWYGDIVLFRFCMVTARRRSRADRKRKRGIGMYAGSLEEAPFPHKKRVCRHVHPDDTNRLARSCEGRDSFCFGENGGSPGVIHTSSDACYYWTLLCQVFIVMNEFSLLYIRDTWRHFCLYSLCQHGSHGRIISPPQGQERESCCSSPRGVEEYVRK